MHASGPGVRATGWEWGWACACGWPTRLILPLKPSAVPSSRVVQLRGGELGGISGSIKSLSTSMHWNAIVFTSVRGATLRRRETVSIAPGV